MKTTLLVLILITAISCKEKSDEQAPPEATLGSVSDVKVPVPEVSKKPAPTPIVPEEVPEVDNERRNKNIRVQLKSDDPRFYICGAWIDGGEAKFDEVTVDGTKTSVANVTYRGGRTYYTNENPILGKYHKIENLKFVPAKEQLDGRVAVKVCYAPDPFEGAPYDANFQFDVKLQNKKYADEANALVTVISDLLSWDNGFYDPRKLATAWGNAPQFSLNFDDAYDFNNLVVANIAVKERARGVNRDNLGTVVNVRPSVKIP